MALGSHYVQHAAIQPQLGWEFLPVLAASVPVGVLVGLILFINSFQDFNADREVGKRTWVVRTADTGTIADYSKPFAIYKGALYFTFLYVFALGISGVVYSQFSTPWILIALLPFLLAKKAMNMGGTWLESWAEENADRQQLPYELLMVNVSTIGTHFMVGILLTLGYFLGTIY
jgi:1,4-dihydroxy-2-naphthoate octaprenyltransferase